ncbi:natural cytotoxicity triggering receptor 2-like isoform X2 [Notamacropus eugenii]|uniref:natural cytotoxicity triggering receptor 2-like isoform X2 n=1 Tax=Notamacropus eugenii TaxID=9315 RepID=UPI003B67205F
MMAQAAPLLLLPFLLMGSQEQVFQMKHKEGQTLTVYCSYKLQRAENRWKTWCKLQENGRLCDRLITRMSDFIDQRSDARVSLEDDTSTGTIIITMSYLTVEDSGIYWCGIYDFASNTIAIIKKIRLEVAPATILKTAKHSQPTTKTPLTTSGTALATISPRDNQKFIIWGSVLVILLLVGLLSAGIMYAVKISRKQGTGDDDGHHVYDDLEEQKKKARTMNSLRGRMVSL